MKSFIKRIKSESLLSILRDVKYFFDQSKENRYIGRHSIINISTGNFPNSTYKQPFLEIDLIGYQQDQWRDRIYRKLSFIVNIDMSLKHESNFMLYNEASNTYDRNSNNIQFTKEDFVGVSKKNIFILFNKMGITVHANINYDICILLLLELVENSLYRKIQLYDFLYNLELPQHNLSITSHENKILAI